MCICLCNVLFMVVVCFDFNNIGLLISQSAKHFFLINIVRYASATRDV